jgi:hypothetical protein
MKYANNSGWVLAGSITLWCLGALMLIVGWGAPAAYADATVFTMCPSGREGVIGGHTSCAFADNVRAAYYASGMMGDFIAWSPVTGERYEMICGGDYLAHFGDGTVLRSTRCFAGTNADVVIW